MLSVKNLTVSLIPKRSEARHLVENVSFEIPIGKTVGLVGESGSGKSLTAMSIMGLLPGNVFVTNGTIYLKNHEIKKTDISKLRGDKIAMIFQEPMTALNPVMRCGNQVMEAILKHKTVSKYNARQHTIDLFRKVQLPRPEKIFTTYPHEISGGQKQRVMIAMALANKPDILIADEPTTALDVTVQKEILLLLKKLQQDENMGLLFITHDLAVVENIADFIVVMNKGKVVEKGKTKQIFQHPKNIYTKGLLACHPPTDVRFETLPVLEDFYNNPNIKPKIESSEERKRKLNYIYKHKPLLKILKLKKEYVLKRTIFGKPKETLTAVNNLSFKVFPGETLGLVGESGSGKTTLGRSLLQLIRPDGGEILFQDKNILGLSNKALKPYRKFMGIVFQDPYSSLNPRITIGNAIMEPMIVHRLYSTKPERIKKTMELIKEVGLSEDVFYRYPHEFSGGQRQRIVIARALALNPKFIVCDEAVSALDVSVQAIILNLLNHLKKVFGFTYIFISHDLSVVRFMSDRIMVMKDGNIVEIGDADDLYYHPKHLYTQKLIKAIPQFKYK